MAYTSSFQRYSWSDANAPQLYGYTGSLLLVLDACLVYGYGSKIPAGWTKPLSNTSSYGILKQGSGSLCSYFLNDNATVATALAKEARMTGWESISSIEAGFATGSGQFPTVAQLAIGQGAVNVRKSATTDSSSVRPWYVFADSSSCYMYISSGDTAGYYNAFFIGDIYSWAAELTGSDNYKAMIVGRYSENTNNYAFERLDATQWITTVIAGHFMDRSYTGTAGSITLNKHGDIAKADVVTQMIGTNQYPNGPDNGIYLSPVYLCEGVTAIVRGTMRGFWQVCAPLARLNDLFIFSGSGDFAGKTFQIFKTSGNGAVYCMETSNTVMAN